MPRSRSSGFESIIARLDVLTFAEDAALLEHGIHQRRLAVVDVGDNGYVSYIRARLHRPLCTITARIKLPVKAQSATRAAT